MDAVWQQLQGVLGLWLVLAVGMALLSAALRSPRVKGWRGERRVRQWLARGLDAQHYHCLHDLTLRLADGSTTQIDHVVLSPYGIFVLETKHFKGWIWGSEHQQTWMQSLYRHRSSFQNPLRQNWRHLLAVAQVLQLGPEQLHSVVVFTGDTTFKTEMPPQVVQGRALIAYLQRWQTPVHTPEQVAQWRQSLQAQALPRNWATRRAHVAQLRQRHASATPVVSPQAAPSRMPVRPRQQPAPVQRTALAEAASSSAAPAVVALDIAQGPAPAPELPGADEALHNMWVRMLAHPPAMAPSNVVAPAPSGDRTSMASHGAPTVCPQCAAPTVARSLLEATGHTRYFVRCSHYPECRFLEAVEAVGENGSMRL